MESDGSHNGSVNATDGDWLTTGQNFTTTTSFIVFRWTSATTVSQYIQAVIYWIIFIVGVPGNLLVRYDSPGGSKGRGGQRAIRSPATCWSWPWSSGS